MLNPLKLTTQARYHSSALLHSSSPLIEYENGKLVKNGTSRPKTSEKSNGRTNGCVDWYLVTTIYWSNGTTTSSASFLYTECDPCQEYARSGRTENCGGSGGGTSSNGGISQAFPTNPQNNQIHEFVDSEGTYKKFKFNEQKNQWDLVETRLLEVTVRAKPLEFPFLNIPWPADKLTILGPDFLNYTYNLEFMIWYGMYCIQNQLVNPCLQNTANHVLDPSLVSNYNKIIQEIFNSNDNVNLILRDNVPLGSNVTGNTPLPVIDGENLNVTIQLNANLLGNSSQEYIASTIYHEAFHALIHYFDSGNWFFENSTNVNEQHYMMFTTSLNRLISGLQSAFPSLSNLDAKCLILKGLSGSTLPASYKNRILTDNKLDFNHIKNISDKYSSTGTSGIRCN